jgi:hypothetical protein
MTPRASGEHFAPRQPHRDDVEVSEWLAELMSVIDEIGAAATAGDQPDPGRLALPGADPTDESQ